MSLAAAARGRPLVIPGARNRLKLAIATPFPSLTKGYAVATARRVRNGLTAGPGPSRAASFRQGARERHQES